MQIIHQSSKYSAYLLKNQSLVVQSSRKSGGIQMLSDHPQHSEYVEAIKTAIDAEEADALCKALLN